jgi:hypothetical protein
MKPRTSAITETVLVVHWPDAPDPATWQALKPPIEAWIGQMNPDYPKTAGPSYYLGTSRQALAALIGRLDERDIMWELEVTTTVKPAEPGVQPVAWRFQLPAARDRQRLRRRWRAVRGLDGQRRVGRAAL